MPKTATQRTEEEQEDRVAALRKATETGILPIKLIKPPFWNDIKIVHGMIDSAFHDGKVSVFEYLSLVMLSHIWDCSSSTSSRLYQLANSKRKK